MSSNKKKVFIFGNFEITKREIIASVSIIAILLLIGLFISSKITEAKIDQNEVYNKAVKIKDPEIFEYGMKTNIGNAFVYGKLKAVDTVTYPEIGDSYMYVEKVKEEYTRHTREVAHTRTVNGKTETYYETETYWTWDIVGSEKVQCEKISFCGVVLTSSKFILPSSSYISTIKKSAFIRYKYYGTGVEHTGTIFTELKNNTISDKSSFYKNQTIEETVKTLESDSIVIIFWVVWALFMFIFVGVFYYIDNKWLE